jgi:ankyrin repeat protein
LAGNLDCVRLLLHVKADANTTNTSSGSTALHLAVEALHGDVTAVLVASERVGVTIGDYHGRTPLHLAAETGQAELFQSLVVDRGAAVGAVDHQGMTPLHLAVFQGDPPGVLPYVYTLLVPYITMYYQILPYTKISTNHCPYAGVCVCAWCPARRFPGR